MLLLVLDSFVTYLVYPLHVKTLFFPYHVTSVLSVLIHLHLIVVYNNNNNDYIFVASTQT